MAEELPGLAELKQEVIDRGLCTACGACAGTCPRQVIRMVIDDYESDDPEPRLVNSCVPCGICYAVCPGSAVPLPALDKWVFGRARDFRQEHLGIFRDCLRGHAGDTMLRASTSSGGVISALLTFALEESLIDAALVAGRDPEHPWRCRPMLATDASQVRQGVRSVMEIVPTLELLHWAVVDQKHSRVGIVGLPCHVHAVRKLQRHGKPKGLSKAVSFVLGLFCNSAKYFRGTEHLLKEYGNLQCLSDIAAMDSRGGEWPGSMIVMTRDGKMHHVATKGAYGSFLASGNYKRDRCLVCIDFTSELADVSVGDVFQRREENRRWGATLVRTEIGQRLVEGATSKGYLEMEAHDPQLIPASGYGWEASKHANVARLLERRRHGWPTPDFDCPLEIEPLPRQVASSTR